MALESCYMSRTVGITSAKPRAVILSGPHSAAGPGRKGTLLEAVPRCSDADLRLTQMRQAYR